MLQLIYLNLVCADWHCQLMLFYPVMQRWLQNSGYFFWSLVLFDFEQDFTNEYIGGCCYVLNFSVYPVTFILFVAQR